MKVFRIFGLVFLLIILALLLPRSVEEYNLMKSKEAVSVTVTRLPNCKTGYKHKFIGINYNDRNYTLRTKCKYVKSIELGQQITMYHKADTEIFLFPNQDVKTELVSTILLAIFMIFCVVVLFKKKYS